MNEESRLFLDAVDKYLATTSATAAETAKQFDRARWAQYAEMGWLAVGMPEALGGFLSLGDVHALFERLGSALTQAPMLDNLVLCGPVLAQHGNAAQRAIAADMVQGKALLALAIHEANQRYDWDQPTAEVVRTTSASGASTLALQGRKTLVACGDQADHYLVLARDGIASQTGLSLLLVPRSRPGISALAYITYDDQPMADVQFDQVAVTEADFVGQRGLAGPMVAGVMDAAYVALAAQAAGAMRKAYDMTLDYAKTRRQFGRTLASNQVIQHALVDMYVAVEEARALYQQASMSLQQLGVPGSGITRSEASRWASAAKAFACAQGRMLGEQSVQYHGAIGMTLDYAVGGYYKRLCAMANQYGDAEWHWLRMRELDNEL